ncbi:hypothetical protein CEXT_187561 [Caerostris extrusa]|uniref:Uncharacterized protein n=1 Tax=Caerostris extrusa TaxID=172846 RepID=A0AAV4WVH9_CAEEX|nr:hypothetical protein CEXT_187561 [Caerostris extrusa]
MYTRNHETPEVTGSLFTEGQQMTFVCSRVFVFRELCMYFSHRFIGHSDMPMDVLNPYFILLEKIVGLPVTIPVIFTKCLCVKSAVDNFIRRYTARLVTLERKLMSGFEPK